MDDKLWPQWDNYHSNHLQNRVMDARSPPTCSSRCLILQQQQQYWLPSTPNEGPMARRYVFIIGCTGEAMARVSNTLNKVSSYFQSRINTWYNRLTWPLQGPGAKPICTWTITGGHGWIALYVGRKRHEKVLELFSILMTMWLWSRFPTLSPSGGCDQCSRV